MTLHPAAIQPRSAVMIAGAVLILGPLAACGSSAPSAPASSTASAAASTSSSSSTASTATSAPANGMACQRVQTDLAQAPTQLASAVTNPKGAAVSVGGFENKLRQDAATGSPALRTAVAQFATAVQQALQSAAGGHPPDIVGLTKEATQIGELCAGGSPSPSP
jgi:hypothetical protein